MILRKGIKIGATRCHILQLKCTKFDFGWTPLGELTALPQTPYLDLGVPTSKGREEEGGWDTKGRGRGAGEGDGVGKGREGRGRSGREGEGRGGEYRHFFLYTLSTGGQWMSGSGHSSTLPGLTHTVSSSPSSSCGVLL